MLTTILSFEDYMKRRNPKEFFALGKVSCENLPLVRALKASSLMRPRSLRYCGIKA
jgi:hypothetical protein